MLPRAFEFLTSDDYLRSQLNGESITELASNITSITTLADLLLVNRTTINSVMRFPKKHYRTFEITKRSGGKRVIHAPRTFLKVFQAYFYHAFIAKLALPDCIHGFLPTKSFITNASAHIGSVHILNVDIKDFFPSCTDSLVAKFLVSKLKMNASCIDDFVKLLTYEGALPQGSPASPSIANHILSGFDEKLISYAKSNRLTYTRYADDITLSSPIKIDEKSVSFIRQSLRESMFELNDSKTRFMSSSSGLEVTGVSVTDHVLLPKKYRNRVRGLFYRCKKYPQNNQDKIEHLRGHLCHIQQFQKVHPRLYADGVEAFLEVQKFVL